MCNILCGSPSEKHTWSTIPFSEGGAQERGFWLLALSRVRNKVKALSLLGKQTVCAWAFHVKDQEMGLDIHGDVRSPPGSLDNGAKYMGFGIYPDLRLPCPVALPGGDLWHCLVGIAAWLSFYFLISNMRLITLHLKGEPL